MGDWYLGLGDGYGHGYGIDYGSGDGDGSGIGYGIGYGYGYGGGDGYGYGDGDGYGYGDGYIIELTEDYAFRAFHYIVKSDNGFRLRNGKTCRIGEVLQEPEISMCKRGLHASFTAKEAKAYAPPNSVLTEVRVWGSIKICNDKLVATHRVIDRVIGVASDE